MRFLVYVWSGPRHQHRLVRNAWKRITAHIVLVLVIQMDGERIFTKNRFVFAFCLICVQAVPKLDWSAKRMVAERVFRKQPNSPSALQQARVVHYAPSRSHRVRKVPIHDGNVPARQRKQCFSAAVRHIFCVAMGAHVIDPRIYQRVLCMWVHAGVTNCRVPSTGPDGCPTRARVPSTGGL